ncbi:unnamed protein product [Protopolystoma xenopodis]|uniref:Uncharacterized protein n=1 Tax=Protopolystoma xenopodis TaxID=117903 RepID=A0A448WTX0_9PLAT|nr:unnamed protein product [Protopolystoma xenopodis]
MRLGGKLLHLPNASSQFSQSGQCVFCFFFFLIFLRLSGIARLYVHSRPLFSWVGGSTHLSFVHAHRSEA